MGKDCLEENPVGVTDHDFPEAFRQELDVTSPNPGDSVERTVSMKLMNNDVISGVLGKGLSRGCKETELMEQGVSPDHQKELGMENFSPLVNIPIQEAKNNTTLHDLEANAFAVVNAGKAAKASRRWRRAVGKKNRRTLAGKPEGQEYSAGTKRIWKLLDENEEEEKEELKGKSKI